jgi:uncharacterized membrane protein YraQ (UPF0718 family)
MKSLNLLFVAWIMALVIQSCAYATLENRKGWESYDVYAGDSVHFVTVKNKEIRMKVTKATPDSLYGDSVNINTNEVKNVIGYVSANPGKKGGMLVVAILIAGAFSFLLSYWFLSSTIGKMS